MDVVEIVIEVIEVTIATLATIAVTAVIVSVIFCCYKVINYGKKNTSSGQQAYYMEHKETIEKVMQFISFINSLHMSILRFEYIQSQLIINAVVSSEDLGVATRAFLDMLKNDPFNEKAYKDWYYKQWECFLDETSKKQFYQLPIYMNLWNDDDDWVQINMPIHIPGDIHIFQEVINSKCQEKFGKDINFFIK